MTKLLKETLNSILSENSSKGYSMKVAQIKKKQDVYNVYIDVGIDTSEIISAFDDIEQLIKSIGEEHDLKKGVLEKHDIPLVDGYYESRGCYYDSDVVNDIVSKVPEIITPESDEAEALGINNMQICVNDTTAGDPFPFTAKINGEPVKFTVSLKYSLPHYRFSFQKSAKMKNVMNMIAGKFGKNKASKHRFSHDRDSHDKVGIFSSNKTSMEVTGFVGDTEIKAFSRLISGSIILTLECEFYTPSIDGDVVKVAFDGLKSKI